jgi:Sigma-70, region 4
MPVGAEWPGRTWRIVRTSKDSAGVPTELSYDNTLEDLVHYSDTSVRLRNCITADPDLGQLTIRQYLADPEANFAKSFKTPNLGRKTATELRELVEAFADGRYDGVRQAPGSAEHSDERAATVRPRDAILAVLRQFKFPDALLQMDISVRLRNVLTEFAKQQSAEHEPTILLQTVADIAERWDEAGSALLRSKNFGRKSFRELKNVIDDLLRRRLGNLLSADLLPGTLTVACMDEKFDPNLEEALVELYPSISKEVINPSDPEVALDNGADVRERITDIVSGLSKQQQDVLFRRFGLHDHRTKTLEEIGNEFYVTRERVRQVEAGAIRRLQVGARLVAFKHLLDLEANTLWDTLSLGSELLLPDDLELRHGNLDPVQQLAIAVVYGDLGKWVSASGIPFRTGWIRTNRPVEAIRQMIGAVGDYLRNHPLPRSAGGVAEDLDIPIEDVSLAARGSNRVRVFENYVVERIVGSQVRRTVRFHKVFLEQQNEDLLDFTIVLAAYRARHPEDDVGPRIFDLQMRRAPHLFAPIFDSVWLPLPDQGVAFRRKGVIRYNSAPSAPDFQSDHETIGHWLIGKLRELGPCRAVDLRDHAAAEFGPTILASSVQATLVMEPTFIRLAPGVFGLQEHAAALSVERSIFPDSIFSLASCRYYIMARKAGEPMNLYPGWNYGFEAQLCRWSQLHSPNEVFLSLLHVAAPENWPVSGEERTAWMRTKSIYARYQLDRPHGSVCEAKPPSGANILAALAVLGTFDGLSWISVNRTAHRRLDSSDAVAELALLVALNAIAPAEHWQNRHFPEAEHRAIFAKMTQECSRTGKLSWNRGNLRLLVEEARNRLAGRALGWVDQNEVQTLIDGLLEPTPSGAPTFEPLEPEEIPGRIGRFIFKMTTMNKPFSGGAGFAECAKLASEVDDPAPFFCLFCAGFSGPATRSECRKCRYNLPLLWGQRGAPLAPIENPDPIGDLRSSARTYCIKVIRIQRYAHFSRFNAPTFPFDHCGMQLNRHRVRKGQ